MEGIVFQNIGLLETKWRATRGFLQQRLHKRRPALLLAKTVSPHVRKLFNNYTLCYTFVKVCM